MTTVEQDVARHYARESLEEAILAGLRAMGRDPGAPTPDDLAAVDEFHIGGREATEDLAAQLDLKTGMALLDIGCGIGGAARVIAGRYGAHVTGIDLTPEFIAVATTLTARVGLADKVEHRVASALALPFADGSFDAATMLHVGMNIEDKGRLCAEVARVLRPGGRFAIYDVMRTAEGDPDFPVPWATTAATSFLDTPLAYRRALGDAGFEVVAERDRGAFALDFFRRMQARIAESGPPPLGIHILMGPEARTKIANVIAAVERGILAPREMIGQRRG
ncbi:MAG TPA: methyltransferase domain-containing protein [Alphaproteobacteria bacterium]|nr:methyltransferase domain-containing protein [Alphaproteobacteria bacterium]